jgi:uncharacterized membrane protein
MKNIVPKHFTKTVLKGLFGLLPITITLIVILWLYGKVDYLAEKLFGLVGFTPQNHEFLWLLMAITLFLILLYIMGNLMETRLVGYLERLTSKIPGYKTIKDIINIFNSSKEGENRVLVVVIKGFAKEGYNIGLMYSQKESIVKDHYTVTLSMSPIPNGGFMFEVHKSNIFVIEEATFDDNLQYLLSMGVKSFTEVIKTEPRNLSEMVQLGEWLERGREKEGGEEK